jgi:hypothetical protein
MEGSLQCDDQQNSQTGAAYSLPHKHLPSLDEESNDKLHNHISHMKQIMGGTFRKEAAGTASKKLWNQHTDHVDDDDDDDDAVGEVRTTYSSEKGKNQQFNVLPNHWF